MLDFVDRPLDRREQRLQYLTLHVDDLWLSMCAPLWLAFTALPFMREDADVAVPFILVALLATPFWIWLLRRHLHARFGRATLTQQSLQLSRHGIYAYRWPMVIWVGLTWALGHRFRAMQDLLSGVCFAALLLVTVLDKTSLPIRRLIYAIAAGAIVIGVVAFFLLRQSVLALGFVGFVLLALGIFDYMLLVHLARPGAAHA